MQVVEAADRLGYAWISCSDHVAVPQAWAASMGPTWYDPVATLAFCAARTTRIGLLSHVFVLPYRHPLVLAKAIASLDRLSAGRLLIGVGSGHLKPEFRSLGLDHGRRGAQTDENLRALRQALEQPCTSFDGEFASWRDMLIEPRPVQQPRPPIWVGGNGRRALKRAIDLGDGWIPWEIELEEFRRAAAAVVASGRDLERVAPLVVAAAESATELGDRLRRWREAGATAFHLNFEHRSLEHLLQRLTDLAPLTAAD
jgi:probable F420-dependent oxidoreductase